MSTEQQRRASAVALEHRKYEDREQAGELDRHCHQGRAEPIDEETRQQRAANGSDRDRGKRSRRVGDVIAVLL